MKPSLLIGQKTHLDILSLLETQKQLIISGASNQTAKALLLSHFLEKSPNPTLLVTDTQEHADAWEHWLSFFGSSVSPILLNPSLHPTLDEDLPVELLQRFLLLQTGAPHIYIATRDVWDTDLPLLRELEENKMTLKKGEEVAFTGFVEQLLDSGYQHADDRLLHPGEYRRTGDTLEIFPVQLDNPYRIDFKFDTVEKITKLDEMLAVLEDAGDTLEILPVAYTKIAPLIRQLPKEGWVVLDDQDDIPVLDTQLPQLRFTSFPEVVEHHAHLRYLSVLKFYTLTDFLNDLRDKVTQGWTLVIMSRRFDELVEIFNEENVPYTTKPENQEGAVTVLRAEEGSLLPHSIQNPDLQCALLTDREIFSLKKAGKQRSVQKLALDFLTSLTPGDYVVHMEHGIGRFEGATQKIVDETVREYLELSYAEGDKLFIPVDQADKLSKFVHEEGQEPVLTRLGTSEWKKVSERIRKETEETAKDLLALYAKRASAKGFAYGDDTDAMAKFEESFPYQETPGQLQAIEDLKKDMEDDHPMDRLVCGDVGFGKTEVAMRAAFKGVQDGKQVAVVAPITILADQHFQNFKERMKDFPVRIEMLSRFRSPKEQREILEKLRKGDLDIVIGTHRLLQDDVKFLNLGLVIVDEEQRFGVKQKEKFKEMRAAVDVLTLTATPIPRTLNLGLHKLRDITTITTPPPGRLPIITEVRKYSDELIRQAIVTEIKRNGQCFVLHNKVKTIDAFAEKLRQLVPEASFVVAHGQLTPDELEKRIMSFKKGEHLVLVSSTIIENGIDLPRANTLIVNEAERFGLSQLYQLRGRVGRGKVQAYAYLLYHSQKLPEDAKKRLRAIVEACELGSGFQVAMRDLEIRGAGEILGVSQAGTMQTVGVSHYLRMLKHAMEEIKAGKKETTEIEENVEILLNIEALLPSFYIPDSEERISMYQKLAGAEDEAILAEFEKDVEDEYGPLPKPVQNLFALLRLKMACRRSGVIRIKSEEVAGVREVVLTLSKRITAEHLMPLLQHTMQWRISGSTIRIKEEELLKLDTTQVDVMAELTRQVERIERKAKKKKKE